MDEDYRKFGIALNNYITCRMLAMLAKNGVKVIATDNADRAFIELLPFIATRCPCCLKIASGMATHHCGDECKCNNATHALAAYLGGVASKPIETWIRSYITYHDNRIKQLLISEPKQEIQPVQRDDRPAVVSKSKTMGMSRSIRMNSSVDRRIIDKLPKVVDKKTAYDPSKLSGRTHGLKG